MLRTIKDLSNSAVHLKINKNLPCTFFFFQKSYDSINKTGYKYPSVLLQSINPTTTITTIQPNSSINTTTMSAPITITPATITTTAVHPFPSVRLNVSATNAQLVLGLPGPLGLHPSATPALEVLVPGQYQPDFSSSDGVLRVPYHDGSALYIKYVINT
jgi:hypothetical protein